MAKTGFPFYRAETDRFQDIKIKRLRKRYHCTGYAVYQFILNEIYRVEGCYLSFGEDEAFEVAEYWAIEEAEVIAITNFCCEIGLFDAAVYDTYNVLTARSIQSRYIDMCKLSKRKVIIPEQYVLLSGEEMPGQTPQPSTPIPPASSEPKAPETPEKAPEIPKTSGKNADFPEKTPETPEKIDREEKSREEREKNIPPTVPRERKEEEILSSTRLQIEQLKAQEAEAEAQRRIAAPNAGGGGRCASNRNTPGLLYNLQQYNLTPEEIEEVLRLSNYGEIGGEVWKIIEHIRANAKAIKAPRYFLLSRLRGACAS